MKGKIKQNALADLILEFRDMSHSIVFLVDFKVQFNYSFDGYVVLYQRKWHAELSKGQRVFHFLLALNYNIYALQETHLTSTDLGKA